MKSPVARLSVIAAFVAAACAYEALGPSGVPLDADAGDSGSPDGHDAGTPDAGEPADAGDAGEVHDGGDAGTAPDGGADGPTWTVAYDEAARTLLPGVHAFDLLDGAPITTYSEAETLYVARVVGGRWTRRPVTITNGLVLRQPACALTPAGQLHVAGFVSGRGVWEGTIDLADDSLRVSLTAVEDMGRTYADLRLAIAPSGRRTLVYRSWTAGNLDRRVRLKVGSSGIVDEYKETDFLDLALDSAGDPVVLAKWQSSLFLSAGASDLDFVSLWGDAQSASLVEHRGTKAVAWGDLSLGVTTLSVRADEHAGWVRGTLAGPSGGTAGTAIAMNGEEGLVVAWPAESGAFEVWAAQGGWKRIGVRDGLLASPLQHPRMRVAPDGTIHVVAHSQGDPARSLPATIAWLRYGR